MKRVIASLLCLLLIFSGCASQTATAFTVNGVEVERKELLFYMNRLLDETVADIETEYNIDSTDKAFWNTPVGESTPLELLKAEAVKVIVRNKTEMLTAKEYDIEVLPFAHSKQMRLWERDNNERQRKEANGETVYGNVLRSFYTFFQDKFLTMQNELKTALEKEGKLKVTENELKLTYEKYKSELDSSFAEARDTVHGWVLNEKYEKLVDSLTDSAEIIYKDMEIDPNELS